MVRYRNRFLKRFENASSFLRGESFVDLLLITGVQFMYQPTNGVWKWSTKSHSLRCDLSETRKKIVSRKRLRALSEGFPGSTDDLPRRSGFDTASSRETNAMRSLIRRREFHAASTFISETCWGDEK